MKPDLTICHYCQRPVIVVVHGSTDYPYPYRRDYGPRLSCPPCAAHVGCHFKDPTRPLGTVANAADRELRKRAHEVLDPLWNGQRKKKLTRKKVYAELDRSLGREIHISWNHGNDLEQIIAAAHLMADGAAVIAPDGVEYFCPACKTLRLHLVGPPTECRQCGATEGLVTGKPGTLDIEALRGGDSP